MCEGCLDGMDNQRRVFLQALGAGLGLASAGCLARGPTQQAPDGRGNETRQGTTQPAETTAAQTTVSEQPEADAADRAANAEEAPQLAATTERIMDEMAWFADEYSNALEAYKEAGDAVTSAVSEVGEMVPLTDQDVRRLDGEIDRPRMDQGWPWDIWWEKGEKRWRRVPIDWQDPSEEQSDERPLAAPAIERLRDETQTFADTFEAEFEPHFTGAKKERRFATDTIDTIATFSERNDTAMVVAGLVRLYQHYQTITGAAYVNANLSDDPIRNRLAEYLAAPGVGNASVPPLFEFEYRGQSTHAAFAHARSVSDDRAEALYQAEPAMTIDGSARVADGVTLQDAVDALEVSAGRVDRCYLIVSEWKNKGSGYYSAQLPSQTVFVQRYGDVKTAAAAKQRLFERNGVTRAESSSVQIGDGESLPWDSLFFQHDGETWYAAFRRIGRHLVIVGVARRPLEHRGGEDANREWTAPLELSWIRTGASLLD